MPGSFLVLQNPNTKEKYFIPRLCIIQETSELAKLRVVFDDSANIYAEICLIDLTFKGYQVPIRFHVASECVNLF